MRKFKHVQSYHTNSETLVCGVCSLHGHFKNNLRKLSGYSLEHQAVEQALVSLLKGC